MRLAATPKIRQNLANRAASSDYRAQDVEGTDKRTEPYILLPKEGQGEEESVPEMLDRLQRARVNVDEELPLLKGFKAVLNPADRARAERNGFRAIPDREGSYLPTPKTEQQAAPRKKEEPRPPRKPLERPRFLGPHTQVYTGKGVGIAVIDTGIYPHPDLTYPHSRIVAFQDFVNGKTLPYDDNGHGTHVAGDAAGSGFLSGGLYRGSAPDADLVGIKVLDKHGRGTQSRILAGLNWAIENKARYNIRVVNLSLGSGQSGTRSPEDPLRQAVDKAVDAGLVVVVSAGNNGPNPNTISSPGNSPKVITVAAVDDNNTPTLEDDRIPSFSARGPVDGQKPDLAAPGEGIVGPSAPNSVMETKAQRYTDVHRTLTWLERLPDEELVNVPRPTLELIGLNNSSIRRFQASPARARRELDHLLRTTVRMPIVDRNYIGIPGTSAAAPIVAGVVAQMLEANPELTPDQVKEILTETARPIGDYAKHEQGAGMVDPERAIQRAVASRHVIEENGQMRFPFLYS